MLTKPVRRYAARADRPPAGYIQSKHATGSESSPPYTVGMRYIDDPDALFWRGPLSNAIDHHCATASVRVQAIADTVLRAVSDDELVEQLASELAITPLTLSRESMTMQREEVQIDVTNDGNRISRWDGGRLLVPGVRVTVTVPYQGDTELWRLQPSSFHLTVPRGQVRRGQGGNGFLDLKFEVPNDQSFEKLKADLDSQLVDIEFFIENQRKDLAGVGARIRREVSQAITARRERLRKQDGLSALLGIPEVKPVTGAPRSNERVIQHDVPRTDPATSTPGARLQTPPNIEEGWDVFVSHASEDKEPFVRPLVSALTKAGLRVWYDEQALTIGDSLRRSIDKGLARSKYGIVVISPAFLAKHWPQKELDGLVAREEDGSKVILPIWHNITAAQVRLSSPTLADRLAVSSTRGVDEVVRELLRVVRSV